jgi:hypothetical protein
MSTLHNRRCTVGTHDHQRAHCHTCEAKRALADCVPGIMLLFKCPLAHWSRHLLVCWVLLRVVHADQARYIANDSGVPIGVTVKRKELRGIPPATSWQVVPCLDNVEVPPASPDTPGACGAASHHPRFM